MTKIILLGTRIFPESRKTILEKIKKYINQPTGFMHIVSLNPENIVEAQKNQKFKRVIETAQIQIIDGVGVQWALRLLAGKHVNRITGVDLMEELVKMAGDMSLRAMLIGGKPKVAQMLAECYNQDHAEAIFIGIEGIKNIRNPQKNEEKELFSIVASRKPHIIFVSFGSPWQELWIERHKKELDGIVCMGVGGAFDFLSGEVSRAPRFIRTFGLEWLFRLIHQPWRWRRQLRLFEFVRLVLKEKFSSAR